MHLRTLVLFTAFLLPLPMMADTTYNYTGTNFTSANGLYSTSDSVSLWFTVASPLQNDLGNGGGLVIFSPDVTAFSFSDGVQTISYSGGSMTYSNGTSSYTGTADLGKNAIDQFEASTDANGNIDAWNMAILLSEFAAIGTKGVAGEVGQGQDIGAYADPDSNNDYQGSTDVSGTWSSASSAATPEPSSFLLLLTGLACMAGLTRRRLAR